MRMNSSWIRRSPVTSGWNDVASRCCERTATARVLASVLVLPSILSAGPPMVSRKPCAKPCAAPTQQGLLRRGSWTPASTSTPPPTRSTHGARMNTACTGVSSFTRCGQTAEVQVRFEGLALAAEGIAPDRDVQSTQGLLRMAVPVGGRVRDLVREQDHARTATVDRHAGGDPLPERLRKPEDPGQLVDSGGLAAGNDQTVDGGQLSRGGARSRPWPRWPRRPGHVRGRRPAAPGCRRSVGCVRLRYYSPNHHRVSPATARRGARGRPGLRRRRAPS